MVWVVLIQAYAGVVLSDMMRKTMSVRRPPEDADILPFPTADEPARLDRAAQERDEETALMVRVREHADSAAFSRLFEMLAPRINSHLRRGGMAPADAENLLQDIFLVVWRKAAMFDAKLASARTWIFTLVRNRRIDLERAAQREQRLIAEYARSDAGAESYEVDLLAQAFGARIGAMLTELPVEQRDVLLKCYVEGKSQREIAIECGLPIGTVKSRARLAFERVRAAFGEGK
jgi:RNA polymerase sigma-70 factor (ECF subfamily)